MKYLIEVLYCRIWWLQVRYRVEEHNDQWVHTEYQDAIFILCLGVDISTKDHVLHRWIKHSQLCCRWAGISFIPKQLWYEMKCHNFIKMCTNLILEYKKWSGPFQNLCWCLLLIFCRILIMWWIALQVNGL